MTISLFQFIAIMIFGFAVGAVVVVVLMILIGGRHLRQVERERTDQMTRIS